MMIAMTMICLQVEPFHPSHPLLSLPPHKSGSEPKRRKREPFASCLSLPPPQSAAEAAHQALLRKVRKRKRRWGAAGGEVSEHYVCFFVNVDFLLIFSHKCFTMIAATLFRSLGLPASVHLATAMFVILFSLFLPFLSSLSLFSISMPAFLPSFLPACLPACLLQRGPAPDNETLGSLFSSQL